MTHRCVRLDTGCSAPTVSGGDTCWGWMWASTKPVRTTPARPDRNHTAISCDPGHQADSLLPRFLPKQNHGNQPCNSKSTHIHVYIHTHRHTYAHLLTPARKGGKRNRQLSAWFSEPPTNFFSLPEDRNSQAFTFVMNNFHPPPPFLKLLFLGVQGPRANCDSQLAENFTLCCCNHVLLWEPAGPWNKGRRTAATPWNEQRAIHLRLLVTSLALPCQQHGRQSSS